MKAKVTWNEGLRFIGEADSGHALVMDGDPAAGGGDSAARPSELLLLALGGCTGMDVVSILRKKRQHVDGLEIRLEGEKAEDHPRSFTKVTVEYRLRGRELDAEAVRRAVELSEDKYCSVGFSLKRPVEVVSRVTIVPEGG